MKLEISDDIVKKFKSLNECCDFSKDELKEYLNELTEELLEDYLSDKITQELNDNNDEYEDWDN